MTMIITTNHHRRDFIYRYDVPDSVLADQFDYQDPDETTDGFIQWRGYWYHLDQFMIGAPGDWHGVCGESYFSGMLIKVHEDGTYTIASYRQ